MPGKLVGGGLVLIGAFSFSRIWELVESAGGALADNVLGAVLLVLGLAILGFLYRDALLSPLGAMGPERAARLVRIWLESEGCEVVEDQPVPDFVFKVKDNWGRNFGVSWQTKPYRGVQIDTVVDIGVDQSIWARSTRAELRRLDERLMEITVGMERSGVSVTDIADATKARVVYGGIVPRDLINYDDFFHQFYAIQGRTALAIKIMNGHIATLQERLQGGS